MIFGFLSRIFGQKLEELPPELRELAEKFRRGIAKAIGVPPEYISEEKVYKWVVNWAKAWTKPEYWQRLGISAQAIANVDIEEMGYELGRIIMEALRKEKKGVGLHF